MAGCVLLIDWPNQSVPRALLDAGFTVVSTNVTTGRAATYELADSADPVAPADGVEVIAAEAESDAPLVIRRREALPDRIDIVALFRPEAEHVAIVRRAIRLGARVIWVQRDHLSDEARDLAAAARIDVVETSVTPDAVHRLLVLS